MINKSKFEIALTLVLVLGTWALVITSICNTKSVKDAMDEQVEELRKSTELQWRPFLHIEHVNPTVDLKYISLANSGADTIQKSISSVSISSPEFSNIISVLCTSSRKLRYHNSGSTPLNITFPVLSLMTENIWVNIFEKSPDKLVSSLPQKLRLSTNVVDVVVLPDSTRIFDADILERSIRKDSLVKLAKEDREVVFYNVSFVKYEDFFENEYNTLLIDFIIIPLVFKNDVVTFDASSVKLGLEVYLWDVLLEELGI